MDKYLFDKAVVLATAQIQANATLSTVPDSSVVSQMNFVLSLTDLVIQYYKELQNKTENL